jgi:hypothetical protein
MSNWEPYFRPTRRVHDSGFRCFECGYIVLGNDKKAKKKVVIARGVDHISNRIFSLIEEKAVQFDMDLLRDGNIRIYSFGRPLYWRIPGFSDATITYVKEDPFHDYDMLDELWEQQNAKEEK